MFRPAEVDLLVGDAAKAQTALQWEPTTNFVGLVKEMVHADVERLAASTNRQDLATTVG